DGAVVVTTPQEVSLLDVRKSIAFAKAVKMDILGVIENMSGFVCPHCGKQTDIFKIGGGEAAAKELGLPFLGRVPIDPRIVIGGVDVIPNREGVAGFSSTFILPRRSRSARARATSSKTGATRWQGPHHSAQKSTRMAPGFRTSTGNVASLNAMGPDHVDAVGL